MRATFLVFFVLLSFNFSNAQVIGKIFDKDYADQEFGEVLSFVEVDNNTLTEMLTASGEYIMFNIETGSIRALNAQRESVQGSAISGEEVFYKMSTSQVELLLSKGLRKTTRIEMRPKTLTVTNGGFTLELSEPCPPHC